MTRGRIITRVATVAVVAMLIATGALFASATATATTLDVSAGAGGSGQAALIVMDGVIDNHTRDTFFRRFRAAEGAGAQTIILKLNVSGGLASPALDISSFIRGQTGVRTIAFVQTQALSAGTVIGLACDELYMSPDARIGDAAPIAMSSSDAGGGGSGGGSAAAAQSPILADFYASATTNGYDPLLTSAMVTFGRVVHYVQDESGSNKKFVGPAEYETLTKAGWRPVAGVPDPLDGADTVLTVDSRLAELIGLSKGTFASPQALAAARNLNLTTTYAPTAGDHLLAWLGTGFVRMVLIIVLMQALYLALSHPGHGWPEAMCVIVLAVLLGVPMLTGYAGWIEALAIILGLALLALEIFVIPGFGAAGLLGILLVIGGLIMTFVGSEPNLPGWMPSIRNTWMNVQRGLMFVTAAMAISLVMWVWLSKNITRMPYLNRLVLTSVTGDVAAVAANTLVETGPAVGDAGVAVTDLKPGGSVKFLTEGYPDGRVAAVVSDSGFLKSGSNVIVREVAGNRIVVEAAET